MSNRIKLKHKNLSLYEQNELDCWRISLANLLQISPEKVPDFVKEFDAQYVSKTREWLNEMGKSLVYIPSSAFMESMHAKKNNKIFPQGKCIALIQTDEQAHACLMVDGELFEYEASTDYIGFYGYFIVYDIK